MTANQTYITLRNGTRIPLFGLDTVACSGEEVGPLIGEALKNGIRHIAAAAESGTEAEVGEAIRKSGVPRQEICLTDEITGINNTEATIRSANASLRRLGADYVDLFLLTWIGGESEDDPKNSRIYKAWKGLERLYKAGAALAIGIVDFAPWQVEYLLHDVEIAPMVCYAGLYPGHPDFEKLMTYAEHNILTMAYAPRTIGNVESSRELALLAESHQCTPRDIVLQYLKQKNCVVTIRQPVLPSGSVTLSEEEMIFLDMMNDYAAE